MTTRVGTLRTGRTAAASGSGAVAKRTAAIYFAVGLPLALAVMVGLGWLITHSAAHSWPFTAEDGIDRALARHRTPALNTATKFLSTVADTIGTIVVAAVAVVAARVLCHRWRESVFIATAIAGEVTVFLLTTLIVARPRPALLQLDVAPPTSSFPSGHTAAAVALYGAVILAARYNGVGRWIWLLAAMPLAVGGGRLYRGMHHPSDVLAGILLGAICLAISHRAVLARDR